MLPVTREAQPSARLRIDTTRLSGRLRLPDSAAYRLDSNLYNLAGARSVPLKRSDALVLQATTPQPDHRKLRLVLLGLGLLTVLAGLWLTYKYQRTSLVTDLTDDFPTPAAADSPSTESSSELATESPDSAADGREIPDHQAQEHPLLDQYLRQFYERYGDLYQYLHEIPIEPDERQKQTIRRRLVEMALHAHSLARAYKHDPSLSRITDEPNLQLIWYDKQVGDLPPDRYKPFEQGAYAFSKKHQFLQEILQEMNLGHLNGALMQTIYLPPAHL